MKISDRAYTTSQQKCKSEKENLSFNVAESFFSFLDTKNTCSTSYVILLYCTPRHNQYQYEGKKLQRMLSLKNQYKKKYYTWKRIMELFSYYISTKSFIYSYVSILLILISFLLIQSFLCKIPQLIGKKSGEFENSTYVVDMTAVLKK